MNYDITTSWIMQGWAVSWRNIWGAIAESSDSLLGIAVGLSFVGDAASALSFHSTILLLTLFLNAVTLSCLISASVTWMMKDKEKGALVSIVASIWFFYYSTLQKALGDMWTPLSHHRFALPTTILSAGFLIVVVLWTKKSPRLIQGYSQIVGVALIVYLILWRCTLINVWTGDKS